MKKIYMDYAATTPVDRQVIEAMLPYYDEIYGNPSSIHSAGQKAKAAIEDARSTIASCLGANSDEIVFTGSGTESNNLAIKGVAYSRTEGSHIITSSTEHHSVLESCLFLKQEGFDITVLPVDSNGLIDPDDVLKSITEKTVLVSIMHGNNEIGTIQPIDEIGSITREKGVLLHVDAVQSFGHIPVDVEKMRTDLLSISAHKFYGPKGVGVLYIKEIYRLSPFCMAAARKQAEGHQPIMCQALPV